LELKVFLGGRIVVEGDGVLIDEEHFPGRQGRLLFAYLVAEQGRPVPRDELAEALWGDAPPATWEKALTVVVSKLRALLAEHGVNGPNTLTSAFGCYRLHLPEHGSTSSRRRRLSGRRRRRSPQTIWRRRRRAPCVRHRSRGGPSCPARRGLGSTQSGAS
jgi:Transcriptional regulatory protein, C terminal